MRYRYLIEHTGDEYQPIALTTITRGDVNGRALSVASIERAKELAAADSNLDGEIRWNDPPVEWQPDAIAVSQWIDDGVEAKRDS